MFPATELSDVEWLVSTAAEPWLAAAAADTGSLPARVARLRKSLSAERAALVCEQVELRRRAADKFPQPDQMFFSRQSLEQATDAWVAQYKAQRFLPQGEILDLCSGIGGDALALAERGSVVAIERDSRLARLARANAEVCGRSSTLTVRAIDLRSLTPSSCGGQSVHIDPDRRPGDRRTTDLARFEPDLEIMEAWRQAASGAAIKLAPATDTPVIWQQDTEREWISRGGVCRQQVAWSGALTGRPGLRRATRVEPQRIATFEGEAGSFARSDTAAEVGRFLHEPDVALIAAQLVDDLANRYGLARLDPQIAYLTSDDPCGEPLVANFEIDVTLPFDVRRVREALAERRWGRLEIKLRGVEERPEVLRERLRVEGDESGTLLLARRAKRVLAILARRVRPG